MKVPYITEGSIDSARGGRVAIRRFSFSVRPNSTFNRLSSKIKKKAKERNM